MILKNEIINCKYAFIYMSVIYIFLFDFFSKKIRLFSPKIDEGKIIKKYEMIKLINRDKKYILVKNEQNKYCSIAEIIVQNKIDFTPKISVIIPAHYNKLNFSVLLETVINQTLKEIEIICVDNGLYDNFFDKIIKFAQKDKRITIIKQENIRYCASSNAGLSVAKGKYLSFLDSDYLIELNMLEEMYNKAVEKKSDIIICQYKSLDSEKGKLVDNKLNDNIRIDLIPNKDIFSLIDIPNSIFQITQSSVSDKLFKTDFIKSNNIKFQIDSKDAQFTFTALCLAKKITIILKRLVIKHKNKLFVNNNEPLYYLSLFDKIKYNLEKNGLFKIVKESYFNWVLSLCVNQLKYLDKESNEYLYNFLNKKINLYSHINKFLPTSNLYRTIHYIKYKKVFPKINIALEINHSYLDRCMISLIYILKNSGIENINIILLYNDISQGDIKKIIQLKDIRAFTMQTLFLGDNQYKEYSLTNGIVKKIWYLSILADKFPDIDRILYLDSFSMIRKNLLPLLEINMNNKLILKIEDISNITDKEKSLFLIDNLYINEGILLINTREWRDKKYYTKIKKYIKNKQIEDIENIKLNREVKFVDVLFPKINFKYNYYNYELFKNVTNSTIVRFNSIKQKNSIDKNSFINEFCTYKNYINTISNSFFTIPLVLSTDGNYAPYLYTTMISILENANEKTFYEFYILVPFNFSKSIEKTILKINNNYKCKINFIYIKNVFKNYIQKISHITLPTYYRLLIGDLLPKEINKCIYLDIDVCVTKDLSEMFNINLNDNYIAGVVAPGYFFNEKLHCKRLNISSTKKYINAGVLVFNLFKIREDKMTQKFIELAKKNYASQDQDVLNVACFGKILTLPPKYNAMTVRLKENHPLLKKLYSEKQIYEAKNNPFIIHYADFKKPWNSIGVYMETYWWNIAKKTPYINNLFNRNNIYKNELKKWWFSMKRKQLNIDNPKTFNEKIQWLKLYDSTPIKSNLSDIYMVRRWIKEKIGVEYLIPIIGLYGKFEDINFQNLPKQFVIKYNYDYGSTIIVKNKSCLNLTDVKSKINGYINENLSFKNIIQFQHKEEEPKIIIEKYLNDGLDDLRKYQIHCFNGIPKFLWIDNDNNNHKFQRQNLYELKLNNNNINTYYPVISLNNNPKLLDKMMNISSILSDNFTYARIDLYIIKEKIFFSKIAFTSLIWEELPERYEKKFASFLKLPKVGYNIDTGEYYTLIRQFSFYPFYIFSIVWILKSINIIVLKLAIN